MLTPSRVTRKVKGYSSPFHEMTVATSYGTETSDLGPVESFTIVTQPAGAPLNGYHDRAPVVLFGDEWKRWLDLDADVADLLGPESRDRFDVVKCGIR